MNAKIFKRLFKLSGYNVQKKWILTLGNHSFFVEKVEVEINTSDVLKKKQRNGMMNPR